MAKQKREREREMREWVRQGMKSNSAKKHKIQKKAELSLQASKELHATTYKEKRYNEANIT